jgi:hypothetical protein
LVARNVYSGSAPGDAAPRRLAAYIRQAHHDLTAQKAAILGAGVVRFPDPAGIHVDGP